MSQIGSKTYHNLNENMISASSDLEIGAHAQRVDDAYAKSTASTAKRWILGILTLGIYAIAQKVKDSNHAGTMRQLSRGAQNFYNALAEANAPKAKDQSRTVSMCGENVTLTTRGGACSITFKDGTTEDVSDPLESMHQIERDVMAHSEYFEKSFVADILAKYKEAAAAEPKLRDGLDHDLQEAHEEWEDYNTGYNTCSSAMKLAARSYKPVLTADRERFAELLSLMFESRLGLTKAETAYIDREVGAMLADSIMDGSVSTAEQARAFINRNASAGHFGTVESAEIFDKYEAALRREKKTDAHDTRWGMRPEKNPDRPRTDQVKFKENYYTPKPNPALPVGEDKAVHDFVAEIISPDYAGSHDRDLTKEGLSDGRRLRTLFQENRPIVAKLMENRAACKADPSAPSLLATIEPEIRKALEEQLDELNKKFDAEYGKRKELLEKREAHYEKLKAENEEAERLEYYKNDSLDPARKDFERLDGEKGREDWLDKVLSAQGKSETGLRVKLGTSDVHEIPDTDLDIIGESDLLKENNVQKVKGSDYLGEKADDIALGLNYFGEMEKKLDARFAEGCRNLQKEVSALIDGVFPAPKNKARLTADGIKDANLEDIIGGPEDDPQMQLVREALLKYFEGMPPMDQRSMLAAGTRYATAGVSNGARLGAILKGAGPVMQKMLQGLDPSMFSDEDFKTALGDMKDKLAPISQRSINAYLFDIVSKSKGAIKDITVLKALGAASVGQALKCVIRSSDGTETNCVVKLLRPDAAMRAQREKAVFDKAAARVGKGMDRTFAAKFAGIMEEMDLRTEAANITRGNEVYSCQKPDYTGEKVQASYGSFSNVHSMRLVPGIEPSQGVMVLEEVPGDTLENYLADTGKESKRIAAEAGGDKATSEAALEGAKQLTRLYDDLKSKHDALVNLAYMWTNEGLFAEGFYHGDVHKGNVMVDNGWKEGPKAPNAEDYKGITLIDFGNAVSLSKEQRKNVIQVVSGSAVGDANLFITGFRALLSKESRDTFDDGGDELKNKLRAIFEKGHLADTAARMTAALTLLQRDYQVDVPGPINHFLDSQKRLQTAMDETARVMKAVAGERRALIERHLESLEPAEKEEMKAHLDAADTHRPKSMMKCITDVVRQNLFAAMKSIGMKTAKNCYERIRDDMAQENLIQA